MTATGRWIAIFLLGVSGVLTTGSLPGRAAELTVAVNHAPPYRILDDIDGRPVYSGIYINVLEEAARRTGLQLTYQNVPFRRALLLMETGGADLMLGPNRTPEREDFMYFLKAELPAEPKAVYIAQAAGDVLDLSDLAGQTVGVMRGASYNPAFDMALGIDRVEATDYATLFRMLDQGRLRAVIVPSLLASHLLRHESFAIRKASLVLDGQPSFIAVSRASRFFTEERYEGLENALIAMREDGTFDRIYQHYDGSGL
ncbi:MAG: transporter substrate-binding domain-containing protein [Pseudomonadota bacterium]